MDSFILEDVNELLRLKKGDSSRLIRIKDACDSNAIVSLSDRKYVERLSSQFLRKPEDVKPKPNRPKFFTVDEKIEPPKENENVAIKQTPQIEKPQFSQVQSVPKHSEETVISKGSNLKLSKNIIFSLAAIALAIILIGVVAIGFDGIQFPTNPGSIQNDSLADFSLKTDRGSYETSDIISISGKMSSTDTGTVKLSIENENTELIWTETVNLKNNGEFSTLLIAGGQGWEKDGKYGLNVEYEEYSNTVSFDFNAN